MTRHSRVPAALAAGCHVSRFYIRRLKPPVQKTPLAATTTRGVVIQVFLQKVDLPLFHRKTNLEVFPKQRNDAFR